KKKRKRVVQFIKNPIMESFHLDLYPDVQVHVALFSNVRNSADLRKRLLAQDQSLSYAFLDAKMVNPFEYYYYYYYYYRYYYFFMIVYIDFHLNITSCFD